MEKDLSTKELLRNPEVFADVVNVHLFDGHRVIAPGDLELQPEELIYEKRDGNKGQLFSDVRMSCQKQGTVISLIQAENQSSICNTMPFRDLGYIYSNYNEQIKKRKRENEAVGKHYYVKEIGDEDRLIPVITLVLYYGQDEWKRPLSIFDMLDLNGAEKEKLAPYVLNHKIHLIPLAHQSSKIMEMYQSDFWHVSMYLASKKDRKKREELFHDSQRRIRHPEELLDALYALSKDKRYLEVRSKMQEKEEEITMCEMAEELEQAGIQKGRQQGMIQGLTRVNQLNQRLIKDNRTAELFQATQDPELQEKLMKEYGL